ncbi:hypothetical protein [Cerasicoccus fimbriatus]|uniref:hypothetical protein n=1 Tax=Cerasicoccus fimbriatus TaxID=3014554 RepID=UPI0022B42D56|nr:hypothetical protein [Cerasicoccus sp. TK19100]
MKNVVLTVISLLASLSIATANVHQSASGSQAYSGSNNAVTAEKMETESFDGNTCARVTASMPRWGYVTYWMGIPTPAGTSIIKFRLYNSGEETTTYSVYLDSNGKHEPLGELTIPADTPANSFVDVELSVYSDTKWSGITLKRTGESNGPSPWIQKVSVILD